MKFLKIIVRFANESKLNTIALVQRTFLSIKIVEKCFEVASLTI